PERCHYIRVIVSEISRITDHLTCVGAGAMELGAFSVFLYMIKAREYLWEVVEMVTGARLTVSYCRVGGGEGELPGCFACAGGKRWVNYDCLLVRMEEMEQSIRIVEQALRDIPPGPFLAHPETGRPIPAAEMVDEGKIGNIAAIVDTRAVTDPTLEGAAKSQH